MENTTRESPKPIKNKAVPFGLNLHRVAIPGVREVMQKKARRLVPDNGADRAAKTILDVGAP